MRMFSPDRKLLRLIMSAIMLAIWSIASNAYGSTTLTISPSLSTYALQYDPTSSSLYAIGYRVGPNKFAFGKINPSTGVFTQIPNDATFLNNFGAIGSYPKNLAIKPSDPVQGKPAHIFMMRNDGLIDINTATGVISVTPLSLISPLNYVNVNALAYDYVKGSMYSVIRSASTKGVMAFDLQSNSKSIVSLESEDFTPNSMNSALDFHRHIWYTYVYDSGKNYLNKIDIYNGVVTRTQLQFGLEGLVFDGSTSADSSVLYAVTVCLTVASGCNRNLVRVDPNTGNLSPIVTVGDQNSQFAFNGAVAISGADRLFTTSLGPNPTMPTSYDSFKLTTIEIPTLVTNYVPKNVGSPSCPRSLEANPINVGIGNKLAVEDDFAGGPASDLSLVRVYNSADSSYSAFGANWKSVWHRRLSIENGSDRVVVTRGDGRREIFNRDTITNIYIPDSDVTSVLGRINSVVGKSGGSL